MSQLLDQLTNIATGASSPAYRKEASIVELRAKTADGANFTDRIRRVESEVQTQAPGHRRSIVLQACRELLSEPVNGGRRFKAQEFVTEEISRLRDEELARYLFYRYRYEMFPPQMLIDEYPPCLQVEVTSICNYRCVFCYQTDPEFTSKKAGHMGVIDLDLFKETIDQAEGNVEALSISCRGEPLSCPTIVPMLAHVGNKFLAFKLNTNAFFLDERLAHALLSTGIQRLVFSADAASEPLYSQFRVHGDLDRITRNIERFEEIRQKHYSGSRIITRVSGVRYKNSSNIDEMDAYWGRMVDEVVIVAYNPWENAYDQPKSGIHQHCSDLWRRMFVWADGRINPCDVDFKSTLSTGKMQSTQLSRAWRSEPYERLRAAHQEGRRKEVSICSHCTFV